MSLKGFDMFKVFFREPKGQAFKASNILNEFSIVYRIWPVPIMRRGSDGFFHSYGKSSGILVKRVHGGEVWYHQLEDYIQWQPHLDVRHDCEVKR